MALVEVGNKVLYEPQDACNKELNAKEKAAELTVYVNGKFYLECL